MARDHRKLQAFQLADGLIADLYAVTRTLPPEERFGTQSQLRRAAVSVATNIVEGSARATTREYCRFLTVAVGSARETAHLLSVAARLGLVNKESAERLGDAYDKVAATLLKIITGYALADDSAVEPEAVSRKPQAASRKP